MSRINTKHGDDMRTIYLFDRTQVVELTVIQRAVKAVRDDWRCYAMRAVPVAIIILSILGG
jgi:hypothetical protein